MPRSLSDSNIINPASNDGKDHNICSIVKKMNHVNMGIFMKVILGARWKRIVVRMFIVPTVTDAETMISPAAASVSPAFGLNWIDVRGE